MYEVEDSANNFLEKLTVWTSIQTGSGHANFVADLNRLISDLDGLHDGACQIASALNSSLQSQEDDELESLIINLEIAMDHLLYHWKSIRKTNWPLGDDDWD